MFLLRRTLCITAITLVILSLLVEETEARRKILRGRRTITRKYKSGTAIPAWSIVVIVGISLALLGGLLYVVMKKLFIPSDDENSGVGNDVGKSGDSSFEQQQAMPLNEP